MPSYPKKWNATKTGMKGSRMKNIAKAITAGLLAGATAIVAPTIGNPWSWWQLLPAGIAGLGTFSAVYYVNDGRTAVPPA